MELTLSVVLALALTFLTKLLWSKILGISLKEYYRTMTENTFDVILQIITTFSTFVFYLMIIVCSYGRF